MKLISFCIPTYEMENLGHIYLQQSLNILVDQTFKDFEVIISDHSKNNSLEILCQEYAEKLDIHYYKNNEGFGSSSANINNAIRKARGKLIKILFQDDFLLSENSLQEIVDNFDIEKDGWLVTACEHTTDGIHFTRPFYPSYNKRIYRGKNTISSPSVVTIKNESPLLFDEQLLWLMDVDYYYRCYLRYGLPKILNTINVVNRIGPYQVSTSLVSLWRKIKERIYVMRKYKKI